MKAIVIAGTASGVGKTTVTTGLMGALSRRKFKVQPFKTGPDYIGPQLSHPGNRRDIPQSGHMVSVS